MLQLNTKWIELHIKAVIGIFVRFNTLSFDTLLSIPLKSSISFCFLIQFMQQKKNVFVCEFEIDSVF